jgi:hypothetical protein
LDVYALFDCLFVSDSDNEEEKIGVSDRFQVGRCVRLYRTEGPLTGGFEVQGAVKDATFRKCFN